MIFSLSECIIWVSLFTAEFIAIVTVNLLSIILFIKNRSLRTRSMHLVISLTVADMLVGALSGGVSRLLGILQDCRVVKFNLAHWENDILYLVLLLFFPLVSLTNIAMISLERFHATFRPFRHRLIKRWVYVVAIAVVWIFPAVIRVVGMLYETRYMYNHLYLLESYCCLCLLVTFVSYTSIFFKSRFGAHPQRHCAAALRQRKLTVTLFITTLVSLLLWLPYNISVFLESTHAIILDSLSFSEYFRFNYSLIFWFFANSLVNPILYTIRMSDFQKALLSLFRRHQRENAAIPLNRY